MKDYEEITVCVKLNIARIVGMPGLLKKIFTSFHKKLGVFRKT